MKKLSLVVALIALVVPSAAQAKGGGEAGKAPAKQHCKALRAEMGAEAFRAAFPGKRGKHALKRCVKAQRKLEQAARKRARAACRADGRRGRALKRCVREKLAATPAAAPESYKNAVEECRGMQADDPELFAEEFGDGPSAFGKCVSEHAQDDHDEAEDADGGDDDSVEDEPEQEPDEDEILDGSPDLV